MIQILGPDHPLWGGPGPDIMSGEPRQEAKYCRFKPIFVSVIIINKLLHCKSLENV